jgi:hypothetical protein
MAFTLAEYKKASQDPLIAGVYEAFINNSPLLSRMPVENINGGAVTFNRETTLPTTAFREVGSDYVASEGVITSATTAMSISGGKLKADRALIAMYGPERLAISLNMQAKSLARVVNQSLFKGDGTSGTLTGLQTLIGTGSQSVDNGTTALSLAKLDEAVAYCEGDNKAIYMSRPMWLRFTTAARAAAINGNIQISQDQFGMPQYFYGGLPIVTAGLDASGAEVLPFTETTSTTSIYVVSTSMEGAHIVQNGGIRNFAPVSQSFANEYDIDWYMNYIVGNLKTAWRVRGITNAAITA